MKEDAGEFLSEDSLKKLIHRYSEFITFPIYQLVEKEEEVEAEDDEEEGEAAESDGGKPMFDRHMYMVLLSRFYYQRDVTIMQVLSRRN